MGWLAEASRPSPGLREGSPQSRAGAPVSSFSLRSIVEARHAPRSHPVWINAVCVLHPFAAFLRVIFRVGAVALNRVFCFIKLSVCAALLLICS